MSALDKAQRLTGGEYILLKNLKSLNHTGEKGLGVEQDILSLSGKKRNKRH